MEIFFEACDVSLSIEINRAFVKTIALSNISTLSCFLSLKPPNSIASTLFRTAFARLNQRKVTSSDLVNFNNGEWISGQC